MLGYINLVVPHLERHLMIISQGNSKKITVQEQFELAGGLLNQVYLFQIRSGSQGLDDALYAIAHLSGSGYYPYGSEEAARREVVAVLRTFKKHPSLGEIATKLANQYESKYLE